MIEEYLEKLIVEFRPFWARNGIQDTDHGIVLFQDVGSCLAMNDIAMFDAIRPTLSSVQQLTTQPWRWSSDTVLVYDDSVRFREDTREPLTLQKTTDLKDIRRYLWISFDSSDDAMLSKMTIEDLRNERDAVSGRMY